MSNSTSLPLSAKAWNAAAHIALECENRAATSLARAVARFVIRATTTVRRLSGESERIMTSSYDLSPEADLFHELLVVPEQVLLIHDAVLPVADGCHLNLVGLSRGVEAVALCNGHGLGEGAFHDTNDRSPFALTKLDRMLFDSRV